MRRYPRKRWQEILDFLKYVRRKFPPAIKLYIILDNWSPHRRKEVTSWAAKANVVFVFTPTYASWFNKIEGIFSGVKYFVFGNSDYQNHNEIAQEIRRYVRWRNTRPDHPKLNKLENSS
jgi:transposase